jgi:hypothetical protein
VEEREVLPEAAAAGAGFRHRGTARRHLCYFCMGHQQQRSSK